MRRKNNRLGFTLIELLVAVSIIALLVSILLPALGKARDQAKKVVCATRMGGIGRAAFTYTMENQGCFPWYADTWPDGPAATVYYNTLAPYLGGIPAASDEAAYGDTSMRNSFLEMRQCPAGKKSQRDVDGDGDQETVYIGCIGPHFSVYNEPGQPYKAPFVYRVPKMGPVAENRQVQYERVHGPSEWVTFLDCYDWGFYSPAYLPLNQDRDGDGLKYTNYGSEKLYNWAMPKIHRDSSNMAFFDGHAENIVFRDFLKRTWGDRSPAGITRPDDEE